MLHRRQRLAFDQQKAGGRVSADERKAAPAAARVSAASALLDRGEALSEEPSFLPRALAVAGPAMVRWLIMRRS